MNVCPTVAFVGTHSAVFFNILCVCPIVPLAASHTGLAFFASPPRAIPRKNKFTIICGMANPPNNESHREVDQALPQLY